MKTEEQAKLAALAASAALITAVIMPVRQHFSEQPRDGFPLSCYPMFSAKRKQHGRVTHLIGYDAEGTRRILHYSYLGAGGMNQVRRQVRRLAMAGRGEELAVKAADALADRNRKAEAAVVRVEVVTGRYNYEQFFAGNRAPKSEIVHGSAVVLRDPDARAVRAGLAEVAVAA
ncbi:hypothetical protein [Crystallibacter crystallopoietes]|uniref:hypothetical protein n=1 Tax=Crystallibacter crystallopoietes TaxID=37928 RepID=UPI0002E161EC|nr:hypothetical protein [Arthrobacter crystallopoietes]